MMLGEALGRWLADAQGQAETMAAIEASGRDLRESAPMRDLRRELASAGRGGAEAVLAAAARFLNRTDAVEGPLRAMIRAALADPFCRPPLRTVSSAAHLGLLLVDDPALSILLTVTPPDEVATWKTGRAGPASIRFGGQRTISKFLKAGGATLSFWEAPEIHAGFTAETSGRCRLAGRRKIGDGETFPLDGRRQSFVIDHAVSDIVCLQAVTPLEAAPLAVEYDSATLAFAGASSTDEASSRVQMMVSLLRIMDRLDAAPLIRDVLASPHFHVRWHAMREFLALDAELALPDLRAMAEADRHPEVRAAAAATLAAIVAEAAEESLCLA